MSAHEFSHSSRKPRFSIGDRVRSVGASVRPRENNTGTVIEIVGSAADAIFRYRVLFADGGTDTFFGFELETLES